MPYEEDLIHFDETTEFVYSIIGTVAAWGRSNYFEQSIGCNYQL